MSAPSTPSFSLFNNLPKEVRLMIWPLNLPGERDVKVHYNIQTGRFHSPTPAPTNLQVCRESRCEAIKEWLLQFGTPGHSAQIRANFLVDQIEIEFDPIRLKAIPDHAYRNIVRLVVGGKDLQRIPTDRLLAQLQDFRNLKHLTLVAPEPEPLCLEYSKHQIARVQVTDGKNPSVDEVVMSPRVRAELDGHMVRRSKAFQQYTALMKQMLQLKSVSRRWKMPTLWLVVIAADGERTKPFIRIPDVRISPDYYSLLMTAV
ncbi:hypothetical protein VTL71DRAFT_3183 [Oculimacula yallundae]|uniref:2EXR domain-containing protein n=1 Tax=Oculimacula yallundae TaxID=86028 RepID=A0ABR4C8M3_9HELO